MKKQIQELQARISSHKQSKPLYSFNPNSDEYYKTLKGEIERIESEIAERISECRADIAERKDKIYSEYTAYIMKEKAKVDRLNKETLNTDEFKIYNAICEFKQTYPLELKTPKSTLSIEFKDEADVRKKMKMFIDEFNKIKDISFTKELFGTQNKLLQLALLGTIGIPYVAMLPLGYYVYKSTVTQVKVMKNDILKCNLNDLLYYIYNYYPRPAEPEQIEFENISISEFNPEYDELDNEVPEVADLKERVNRKYKELEGYTSDLRKKQEEHFKESSIKVWEEELKELEHELEILEKKYRDSLDDRLSLGETLLFKYTFPDLLEVAFDNELEEPFFVKDNLIIERVEELTDNALNILIGGYLSYMHPTCINIRYYDNIAQGFYINRFFGIDKLMDGRLTFYDAGIEEFLDEIVAVIQTKDRILSGKTLDEYNKDSASKGRTYLPLDVFIMYGEFDNSVLSMDNKKLLLILDKARSLGIQVIIVSDTSEMSNITLGQKLFKKDLEYIKKWGLREFNNFNPLDDFLGFYKENLEDAVKSSYFFGDMLKDMMKKNDNKKYSPDTHVYLPLGYVDGDRTNLFAPTLGNSGDPHGIIAGISGAGKSVLNNVVINSLFTMYSPEELSLWLIDLKGSEMAVYLNYKDKDGKSLIPPHLDLCLCSGDPLYGCAIVQYIADLCRERYDLFKYYSVQNLVNYNKVVPKELRLPRVVCFIDEFQQMFNDTSKGSGARLNLISSNLGYISKVARACGVHILLCSQSMAGTLSSDILDNFTLRVGLRMNADIASSIMYGVTSTSGAIREAYGHLYVAGGTFKEEKDQVHLRTPFINDKSLVIKKLEEARDFASSINYERTYTHDTSGLTDINEVNKFKLFNKLRRRRLITYDADVIYSMEDLDKMINKHSNNMKKTNTIILGERCVFSPTSTFKNISLKQQKNNNILMWFEDLSPMYHFTLTLLKCVNQWEDATISLSLYDDSTSKLIIDAFNNKSLSLNRMHKKVEQQNPEELFKTINDIVTTRQEKDEGTYKPLLFFIAGLDNMSVWADDRQGRWKEKYYSMLEVAPLVGVHIVFLFNSNKGITNEIINTSNYRFTTQLKSSTSNLATMTKVLGDSLDCIQFVKSTKATPIFYNDTKDQSTFKMFYDNSYVYESVDEYDI